MAPAGGVRRHQKSKNIISMQLSPCSCSQDNKASNNTPRSEEEDVIEKVSVSIFTSTKSIPLNRSGACKVDETIKKHNGHAFDSNQFPLYPYSGAHTESYIASKPEELHRWCDLYMHKISLRCWEPHFSKICIERFLISRL